MKRVLLILLAALLLVSLAACGDEGATGETTSVSQYKSKGEYTEVHENMTWEKLNTLPVKRADMTEEEMRQLVVDFYKLSKNFVWVSDGDYEYTIADTEGRGNMYEGTVYASFPYVSMGTGNVYRILDYMDPETSVVNIAAAGANDRLFGNQCSMSCQWAWSRVINSVRGGWTEEIVRTKGYELVGPYTYSEDITTFKIRNTKDIIADNGAEIMNKSYAELKHGDGLVRYTTAGHVIMCTGDAHVEYDASGKIDPTRSYILMSDQTRSTGFLDYTNESGDAYKMTGHVDAKYTFQKLQDQGYLPITFKEYLGTDPIEDTEVSCSHTGDTISEEALFETKVTSNYNLSDIYAIFTDSKGNEVYRIAVRSSKPTTRELRFQEGTNTCVWGSMEDLSAKETYTVQIVAQLGTGERPTLWTGTWAK